MFKRELKINLKSFILWNVLIVGLYMMVYMLYPSIMNSEETKMLNQMLEIFPKEVLVAFNMDISSIDTAYGWLKSEGFVFILLLVGCYSGLMGSNILLKEESEKTIEYLHMLPVKRINIVLNKIFASLFYIILMVVIIGVFNYFGLKICGEFDEKQFLLLSITPLFVALPLFSINLFLSSFTHKTKKMTGISLGITFSSYIIQIISSLSKDVEFLKYISVYTLADIRNVIIDSTVNLNMVIIMLVVCIMGIVFTIIRYNFKELV